MVAMPAKDYEDHIARVLSCLKCFRSATLSRNRRFQGIRQPGNYDVDISLDIKLDNVASILIIVECKNWRRPVDRPVIQKLVQTRDAIGAHKAAVVSPMGFSAQAIDVARVHGVALWVVMDTTFHTLLFAGQSAVPRPNPADVRTAFLTSRRLMFRRLNVASGIDAAYELMEVPKIHPATNVYKQDIDCDDPFQEPETLPTAALSQIANAVFCELRQNQTSQGLPVSSFDRWLEAVKVRLRKTGLDPRNEDSAIQAIIKCDYEKFKLAFGLEGWTQRGC